MNLEKVYNELKKVIDKVDFSALWKGFKPLKFAVYNENECYFNGSYVEKTDQFIANTAIEYHGEKIAVWNMNTEYDIEILASKIIHEMFHAFQMNNHESRFPNELDALMKYQYSKENLSIKMEENRLIVSLLKEYSESNMNKLLGYRKYRMNHFSYEYDYEARIEQIEGTASYVELNALRQISLNKYEKKLNQMMDDIINAEKLMPIRIISYTIGALFYTLLKKRDFYFESFSNIPVSCELLKEIEEIEYFDIDERIDKLIQGYHAKTQKIIDAALMKNDCAAEGEYILQGVNVYDARRLEEFVVSTYFVMFEDQGETKVEYGDFVIELKNNKVVRILRI